MPVIKIIGILAGRHGAGRQPVEYIMYLARRTAKEFWDFVSWRANPPGDESVDTTDEEGEEEEGRDAISVPRPSRTLQEALFAYLVSVAGGEVTKSYDLWATAVVLVLADYFQQPQLREQKDHAPLTLDESPEAWADVLDPRVFEMYAQRQRRYLVNKAIRLAETPVVWPYL